MDKKIKRLKIECSASFRKGVDFLDYNAYNLVNTNILVLVGR